MAVKGWFSSCNRAAKSFEAVGEFFKGNTLHQAAHSAVSLIGDDEIRPWGVRSRRQSTIVTSH
jgi:hypothetical protein